MHESFIQFAASKPIPFYPATSARYYLIPGSVSTSRMSVYTPIAHKSRITRFRIVMRGKFPPFFSDGNITGSIIKNGKEIHSGTITFLTRLDIGVVTRHKTSYPEIYFDEGDTIGIYITTRYVADSGIDQYLSAIVNFEDYWKTDYFLQFASNRTIPFSGGENYFLNSGNITTGNQSAFSPIPHKSKLVSFRIITHGKWPKLPSEAYIKAYLYKDGKVLVEDSITITSRGDSGVVTRDEISYPNLEFEKNDTIGIYIQTYLMKDAELTQYLSGVLTFE